MPFGSFKDFSDCQKKVKAENPSYDAETVDKVCGKLKSKLEKGSDIEEHEPSPTKKDTKEIGPVVKAWEFDPKEILNSARKVTGTFHVPKIDKDNEIITKAAMGEAIPDFMHLPILHDFHKERVLGIVTKVWEEADAFHFNALFKATNDVDDAWIKVQKGEYDHVSIFGARLKGNTSCGLNPQQRSVPCISEKIRLDSISACDTNARNDSTSLGLAKAFYTDENNIIKALSSDSGLSHGIYDGGKKGDKMKVHEADGKDVEDHDEDEEEEKKADGSPAVREDIEAKKKDFKERQAGTKRSQGEDYHGGQLEKGDHLEASAGLHEPKPKRPFVNQTANNVSQGTRGEMASDRKRLAERDAGESKRFEGGDYLGLHKAEEDDEDEPDNDKDDVKKCSPCSLQKAKDGLKKIYSMLKHLTASDKKMVEKDEEVHNSMEKAGEGEDEEKAFSRAGKMITAISSPRASEHSSATSRAEHAEHSTRKTENRFKKGGTRPKVTEEPVDSKKIGTSQPTNKNVEEVEKSKGVPAWAGKPHVTQTKEGWKEVPGEKMKKPEPKEVEKGVKSNPIGVVSGMKHEDAKQSQRFGAARSAHHSGGSGNVGDLNPLPVKKGDNMTETEEVIEKANLESEMTDEQFVTDIVKANLKSNEEIVKAAVKEQVDEIRKGFETSIAELKAQLTKIEEQPMVKAAILIEKDGKIEGQPLNYEAIAQMTRR
jgi:hypothetical protein